MTKVKRGFAEALATEVLEPSPQRVEAPCAHYPACGGCRFQDLAYEARSRRRSRRCARARADRAASRTRRSSRPPGCAGSSLPQQDGVLVHADAVRPGAGFHKAGRWDEVLEIEKCWLTTDLGNAIRTGARLGARGGAVAYDQADHPATFATSSSARAVTRAGARQLSPRGREVRARLPRRGAEAVPEVRSVHWAVNDQPSEVTNLPSTLLWGDDAIEEELLGLRFRSGRMPSCRRTPRWPSGSTSWRSRRGPDGRRDGLRPLLRDRHDRAVDGVARAVGLGRRDLGGIGGVRARERRPERDREHRVLRGNVGQLLEELQERAGAGRRRRRPASRRPRRQGAEADGCARRAADRLCLAATRRRSRPT